MKRCWFGAALLAVLLIGGLITTWGMARCHMPVAEDLEQAAKAALAEDWEQEKALTGKARTQWGKYWNISATFADHKPMEEIDGLFAQLEIYEQARDPVTAAAVCAELSRRLEAMSDAHEGSWWNLL